MDDRARGMFAQIVKHVDAYHGSRESLVQLVDGVRRLFDESGIEAESTKEEFEALWAPIDGELELRIWTWANVESASDETLHKNLLALRAWANGLE